jgi:hypothetical protein
MSNRQQFLLSLYRQSSINLAQTDKLKAQLESQIELLSHGEKWRQFICNQHLTNESNKLHTKIRMHIQENERLTELINKTLAED